MNFLKNSILIFILIFFLFSCSHSSKKDKKILQSYILQSFFSAKVADNSDVSAKIFYINPILKSGSSLNLDLVVEANSTNINNTRKKLILVHGWDYNDRDSLNLTLSQQKTRIITNSWADFIKTSTFDLVVLSKSYDIYAFDYLTSYPVDTNGRLFRSRMDTLFGSESGTVVILGHSMGGLISRFAIYEGNKPVYIKRSISTGTPYHGSPWASPQFQASKGTLGEIAAFFTDTNAGKDLAWDNFDGKISGASNTKLTAINAKKDRDDLFYAYYGSVTASGVSGSGASSPGLYLSCPLLGSIFSPSDCVVPVSSASLSGNTLTQTRDLGQYDHFDIKLVIPSIQTTFYADLP